MSYILFQLINIVIIAFQFFSECERIKVKKRVYHSFAFVPIR